ncbi:uncharacterized protein L969DRAFT_91495 [Mixia osmundae IAM 14324]|uniref:Protein arginine methyltransferase NDUFAF7 n=1 Tax=Mixia osmundae (strain CBS 9802 / IAM 14324 / JCM 22182 / KY 12970) TaxID=764103 RepID=G7E0L1_MIXOS|nr:uncharacterized protein L969DRAFT_91495 [Mixia osmundae IAM 14324]KEI42029.1 hypothetical protein L969DRAFT_91495 [Mixia osmundae IAM 14324]GAA96371.1 hypothetical protein E5Q_03037 [Mixia osmundae IAM 14324]
MRAFNPLLCRSLVRHRAFNKTAASLCRFSTSSNLQQQAARDQIDGQDTARRIEPLGLARIIQSHIKAHGPMTLPRYIAFCLSHPTLGYYTRLRQAETSAVIGRKGDFVTSPEISQIFGELIAVWLLNQWQTQGSPARTRLVELGPGTGTLMQDILRTFSSIKTFASTLEEVHLVETSQYMIGLQREKLQQLIEALGVKLHWHDRLDGIAPDPQVFTMAIAHEFFDALPVMLFEKLEDGLREVYVDFTDKEEASATFHLALSPSPTFTSTMYSTQERFAKLPTGTRIELCPDALLIAAQLAKLVSAHPTDTAPTPLIEAKLKAGGAALIIDYGDDHYFSDSLRGFRKHEVVDCFTDPGNTDLTANVDFSWIRESIQPYATCSRTQTQRSFLLALGLGLRLERLLQTATDDRAEQMIASAERLVDTSGMGKQYKVVAITSKQNAEEPFPFSLGEVETH